MQRRTINPFNPKATIALLKENPKDGRPLNETERKTLVDRYLEVSCCCRLLSTDWHLTLI
jgi:hypothetical protein